MKIYKDPHFIKLWINLDVVSGIAPVYICLNISLVYSKTHRSMQTPCQWPSPESVSIWNWMALSLRCWKKWSLGSERNFDDAEEVMGDGTGSCKLRLTCLIDSTIKSFGIQGRASQAIGKLVEGQNNCWCDQHHVFVWFKQLGTNIFNPS